MLQHDGTLPLSSPSSEMNTLMGIAGQDFVLLGGDSAFFRSVVVMDAVRLEHL